MQRLVPASVIFVLVLLCAGSVYFLQDPHFYPWIVTESEVKLPDGQTGAGAMATGSVKISFLGNGLKSAQACQRQMVAMTNALRSNCPSCAIRELACLHPPSVQQRSYLSNEPASQPVALYPAGVVIYESSDEGLAVTACQQSERAAGSAVKLRCVPSNTPKPASRLVRELESLPVFASVVTAIGMLAAWLGCYILIRYERLHGRFSHDHADSGPQKIHTLPTPRIGGVAVFFALMLVGMILQTVQHRYGTQEFGLLIFAAVPAFFVGLVEDVTKKVGVLPRLGVTVLAALVGAWLLDAVVPRLDVPGLDGLLKWMPVAVLFTAFAVGGVSNAFNIIDGYNGLAGGCAVIFAVAIGFIAWRVGDTLVMCSAFAMAGVILGFLAWNWPHGRIFLGDGGAYLVGFWLAELAVILVARNDTVSPWFPVAVLIYPIFETLYSIVRRKIVGQSPGAPDAAHLHQLIHRRLAVSVARHLAGPHSTMDSTRLNSRVAGYFWIPNAALAVAAIAMYESSPELVGLVLLFCLGYALVYRRVSLRDPNVVRGVAP